MSEIDPSESGLSTDNILLPARIAGVSLQEFEDETLVHNPATQRVHVLNRLAARILNACDGGTRLESLVADIVSDYQGATNEQVTIDIMRTITHLRDEQLLESDDSSQIMK